MVDRTKAPHRRHSEKRQTVYVASRVKPDELDAIKVAADQLGITRSALIRHGAVAYAEAVLAEKKEGSTAA